jgi:hypothetical protein
MNRGKKAALLETGTALTNGPNLISRLAGPPGNIELVICCDRVARV